jgi:hypothetical protein
MHTFCIYIYSIAYEVIEDENKDTIKHVEPLCTSTEEPGISFFFTMHSIYTPADMRSSFFIGFVLLCQILFSL